MITIIFSTLSNNQVVTFNPVTDTFIFDTLSQAGGLRLEYGADYILKSLALDGKTIRFDNSVTTVSLLQLAPSNFGFLNGSLLTVGDGDLAALDGNANTLAGSPLDDTLLGLGGRDTLLGGAGNDVLDGGSSADTMRGGKGSDTYVVDNQADLVDESPTNDIFRVSTNFSGEEGNGETYSGGFSPDGKEVTLISGAVNMGGTATLNQILLKSLNLGFLGGYIYPLSTSSSLELGNGNSTAPCFSANGRFLLFDSLANNLVPGDTNGRLDVFLKDLESGAIQRVSTDTAGVEGNGHSYGQVPSPDGRFVAFRSDSTNLVAGDTNGKIDLFVKDLQTRSLQRISTDAVGVQGNDGTRTGCFSPDGRSFIFESYASNLVSDDTNGEMDIFRKDLVTGAVERLSTDAAGNQLNGASMFPQLSADGAKMVFLSDAPALLPGSTSLNLFCKDLATGAIQLVSSSNSGQVANGDIIAMQISADGRYVAFDSSASNLVAGDTNGKYDIFVKELATGAIRLLSTSRAGTLGNDDSITPCFSPDGRYVMFSSKASNLVDGDTNKAFDAFIVANPFVADTGLDTVQASVTYTLPAGVENLILTGTAALAGTGNSQGNQLTGNATANTLYGEAGDDTLDGGAGADTLYGGTGNDTFVVDSVGDVVVEYDAASPFPISTSAAGGLANGNSSRGHLSSDGRLVLFESYGANLTGSDGNGACDIFLKDLETGAIRLVSTNAAGDQGNADSFAPSLSRDGRMLLFESAASNLVEGDTRGFFDIFVKDVATGAIRRASTSASGAEANNHSGGGELSGDGRMVAFDSSASNLVAGDSNGVQDIFVKELQSGGIVRASTAEDGGQANGDSSGASLSADGKFVVFQSHASNLVAGDDNLSNDIFLKDLETGAIRLISSDAAGEPGNSNSSGASISGDGRYVLFESAASNLVPGDTNSTVDLFLKDLESGGIQRLSVSSTGEEANAPSQGAGFSGDGRFVLFQSTASNLVPGETNDISDVFIKDLQSKELRLLSTSPAGVPGNDSSSTGLASEMSFSADGVFILFESEASNLAEGDSNGVKDIFRVSNPFLTNEGGTDTVKASVSFTLSGNVENLILSGSANTDATGNTLNNTLTGNAGNNLLNGSGGADTMRGGGGNDTYVVDNSADLVVEGASQGTDTVQAGVTFALPANVEKLILTGARDSAGTGNARANTLTGNAMDNFLQGLGDNDTLRGGDGNDTLDGGIGADAMAGGFGSDTYVVDNGGDVITETATLGTDTVQSSISFSLASYAMIENLTLTGTANVDATGNGSNNLLQGNLSDNVINGGGGLDMVSYANAPGPVEVNLSMTGAQDTGCMGRDTLISIENFTGSAFDDTLIGNAGANLIVGGAGMDLLIGLGGDDIYVVDNAGDRVLEATSGGTDTVRSRVSHTLEANVENLELTGMRNVSAVGNDEDNLLSGNAGSNLLDGGKGIDTVSYAGVTNPMVVDLLAGTASGQGEDLLFNLENVIGGSGADSLTGDASANLLKGGLGRDTLTGGEGADRYLFSASEESGPTSANCDLIIDFSSGQGDRIDLSPIDAKSATPGDQAFRFIGGAPFSSTNAAGQLRYDSVANILYASTDADSEPEFAIQLTGVSSLTAGDFIL